MKIIRKRGDTSNILQVFIQDSSSTTGAGLTGLANNTSGLTAYYHKDTDTTATAISLVTMTVGTFTSSGFKEIDSTNCPGWYQFCPPDAALSTSGTPHSVLFHLKGASNMAPLPIEVQLIAADVEDTVRLGLTALPNVASGSAGAIPTTGTGSNQISVSSGQVILQTGTGTGQLDFTSGVVKANATQWLGGTIPAVNVTGVPLIDLKYTLGTVSPATAGSVRADAVTGAVGSVTGAVGSVTGNVGGNVVGSVASVTAAITLAAKDSFVIRNATAQAGAGSTITLDASASATDNFYNGEELKIDSGTGAGQTRTVLSYVGSTKVATIDRAWATNPDNTSVFTIFASSAARIDSNLAVTVGTNSDKTGYTASTVSDKTGYSIASGGIGSGAHSSAELNNIADAHLDRNMATGTDSGTDSTAVRTPRQAYRILRNKASIAAGTLTVLKEDDSTSSWTAAISTTAGNPISAVDPT